MGEDLDLILTNSGDVDYRGTLIRIQTRDCTYTSTLTRMIWNLMMRRRTSSLFIRMFSLGFGFHKLRSKIEKEKLIPCPGFKNPNKKQSTFRSDFIKPRPKITTPASASVVHVEREKIGDRVFLTL